MKLDLIYYRNILDVALKNFFDVHTDMFNRSGDDYVFSAGYSQSKIRSIWHDFIENAFDSILEFGYIEKNDIIAVIDECYPSKNILLKFKDSRYFPKKLDEFIENSPNIKWRLAETDIKIDIELLNSLSIDFFNSFMSKEAKISRNIKNKTVFVSHQNLDCYMVFKTIKWIYGKANCKNLWTSCNLPSYIMSMNDSISRYIAEKQKLNKDLEFKKHAMEIKTYLSYEI